MTSCHCCGLIQTVPSIPSGMIARCDRCQTKLRTEPLRRRGNALAIATSSAALILFLPAITLPFLRIEQFGHTRESSLLGGVISMLADGETLVALTVLLFSVCLPPMKLVSLIALGSLPTRIRAHLRSRTFRVIESVGRWGMLDVLLVAVLLAFVKLGELVEFSPQTGLFMFTGFVLLSLLATYFFDDRELWGLPGEHDDKQSEQKNTSALLAQSDAPSDGEASETSQVQDEDAGGHNEEEVMQQRSLSRAVIDRRRGLGWVWLLPLAALLVVGYAVYRSWQERGELISVTFFEAHGLKAGDQLRYRGTIAGEVERVTFSEDLGSVRAEVRLLPDTARLTREGSRYWIVRPEVTWTDLSGLETVVGANYLAVLPGSQDAPRQMHFIGLEQAPLQDARESGGLNIVLQAPDASGLTQGSGIFYRQLRVGGIHSISLANDGSAVEVRAYIRPAYRGLILPSAKFWKTGGLRLGADWSGISVELDSVQSLLESGISMAIPDSSAQPVEAGYRFLLHEQPQEEWLSWRPSLGEGTVPDQLPRPSWAILEWMDVGYLYNTRRKKTGWILEHDGRLLGPMDLLSEPEGAQEESARLFVAGEKIYISGTATSAGSGLGSLPFGKTLHNGFAPSELREATEPEDLLIVADDKQGPVFVAAGQLTAANQTQRWTMAPGVALGAGWHGAPAVAVADGAVIGTLLIDDGVANIGLIESPNEWAPNVH